MAATSPVRALGPRQHATERETFRVIDLNGEHAVLTAGGFRPVNPALTAEARAVFDPVAFGGGRPACIPWSPPPPPPLPPPAARSRRERSGILPRARRSAVLRGMLGSIGRDCIPDRMPPGVRAGGRGRWRLGWVHAVSVAHPRHRPRSPRPGPGSGIGVLPRSLSPGMPGAV